METRDFLILNKDKETYLSAAKSAFRFKDYSPEQYLNHPELIELAKIDLGIFKGRLEQFENGERHPKVGEWIKGYDGVYTRFTHAWDDGIQTGGGIGSFYLLSSGKHEYSGGLDSPVPYDLIELTEERRESECWIFHKNEAGAHRGVDYRHQYRVWKTRVIEKMADLDRLPYQYRVAEVTEDLYYYSLEVVPPVMFRGGFAVGEVLRHQSQYPGDPVEPVYYCFCETKGKYYGTVGSLTNAKKAFSKFFETIRLDKYPTLHV